MNMDKLTLRGQILFLVGVILAAFVLITTASYFDLEKITVKNRQIEQVLLPRVEMLGVVQVNSARANADVLLHTLEQDEAKSKAIEDGIQKWADENGKLLTEVEKGLVTEDGKKLFAKLEQSRKGYAEERAKVLELSRVGKDKEAAEAFRQNLMSRYSEYMDAVEENMRHAKERARVGANDVSSAATKAETTLVVGVVLASLFGVLFALYIVGMVSKKLRRVVAIAKSGDLTARLNERSEDEIGELCRAFDGMTDRLQKKSIEAEAIANGDLAVKIDVAGDGDTLGKAFEKMTGSLRRLVEQVLEVARQVSAGSNQVSDASQSLSQGATEQAASLEQISASVNDMAKQVKENAGGAGQANETANAQREAAVHGGQQIAETVRAMEDINSSSQQISKIIKTIDDIAFQTNLLALNAAVEAARAGKHGKGFAVVADEVRNLASRSAKAAKETSELIEASSQKVERGLGEAHETAKSFQDILNGANQVAELVAGIAQASNAQAASITEISQGLNQVGTVVQQTTASAEETASAAHELASQSTELERMLSMFRL